jgi:3-oxoacyl-(acyl-carrier-protein) synthase
MAVNTPLGDTLDAFYDSLIAGRSAVTHWRGIDTSRILCKVGADLSDYDPTTKLDSLRMRLPEATFARLNRLQRLALFSTRLSLLCAADAWADAGLTDVDPEQVAVIAGGHNFFTRAEGFAWRDFNADAELFDEQIAYKGLDSDQAAAISEMLGTRGPIYTVGGACASTLLALRTALDEIRYHGAKVALVVGPPLDYATLTLQALSLIGALTVDSFNDVPARASRPFDALREGFVPAHGVGVLVVEDADHAAARGARVYADVLGVATVSDANHLPTASADGEARAMRNALRECGVAPQDVDFISAHATSTPQGDLAEIQAIKAVFGDHAYRLKLNAPKSMLGHCCWSSAAVETIAAILQMQRGVLHPSINIDALDAGIDLDVCAAGPVQHEVNVFMKNAFGFGGINAVGLFRRADGG